MLIENKTRQKKCKKSLALFFSCFILNQHFKHLTGVVILPTIQIYSFIMVIVVIAHVAVINLRCGKLPDYEQISPSLVKLSLIPKLPTRPLILILLLCRVTIFSIITIIMVIFIPICCLLL